MLNSEGMRFPLDMILIGIRCYATDPLSYRRLEEMMQGHGLVGTHSTINR
jgi:transposase-like protein